MSRNVVSVSYSALFSGPWIVSGTQLLASKAGYQWLLPFLYAHAHREGGIFFPSPWVWTGRALTNAKEWRVLCQFWAWILRNLAVSYFTLSLSYGDVNLRTKLWSGPSVKCGCEGILVGRSSHSQAPGWMQRKTIPAKPCLNGRILHQRLLSKPLSFRLVCEASINKWSRNVHHFLRISNCPPP